MIIVIGDGMGDSEITVARNYLKGAGGFLEGLDALPLTGQMTTYSVTADGRPDYTPRLGRHRHRLGDRQQVLRRRHLGRPHRQAAHLAAEAGQGVKMVVGYNTSEAGGSQQHTGSQVRVAAYGPGAANVVGLIDQTDLFYVATDAMDAWDKSHPTQSPSPTPTSTPTTGPVNVYTTPGTHEVNGRRWKTVCEPYSQTTRCHTDIWSTTVVRAGAGFAQKTGWHFNNLTYLPEMTRAAWGSNPLAVIGQFTSGGRQWRTECGTAATGRDACRSYLRAESISATRSGSGYTYSVKQDWVFNNQVLLSRPDQQQPGSTWSWMATPSCRAMS